MEYNETIGFVRRRFLPAVATFIIVLVAAVGFSFIVTPVYESDCMIVMASGNQLSLLGSMGVLRELTTLSKTGTPLDTQIELVRLTPRLIECIEKFDLRDKKGEPLEPLDLLKMIDVETYENTDIIDIRARHQNPETAQGIAAFLAENHLKIEAGKNRKAALEAYNLVDAKVSSLKADLEDVDQKLADFKRDEGVIDVQTEVTTKITKLADIETEYYTLRAELAGAKGKLTDLETRLNETDPSIIASTTVAQNPEMLNLQGTLDGAETRLAGLLTKYTENHPDVISTREQIADIRSKISGLAERIVESEMTSPNPVYQELYKEYAIAESVKIGLEGQIATVKGVIDEQRGELQGFSENEVEFTTLYRKQKVLEIIYGEAKGQLTQIPVPVEENIDYSSAGTIVKEAQLPERPISPNKIINAIAGFVIGLILAFIVALVLEYMDKRVRNSTEIVNATGLKFLGKLGGQPSARELDRIYSGILAGLHSGQNGSKVAAFLCFGSAAKGLDALKQIAGAASKSGELTLTVFDFSDDLGGNLLSESGSAGTLEQSLRSGSANGVSHRDGYKVIAASKPYPVDLLFGKAIEGFMKSLKAAPGRAFILAPVSDHAPAAHLVCASCDGTVLLIEPSRTTLKMIEQAIVELTSAGAGVIGFVEIG